MHTDRQHSQHLPSVGQASVGAASQSGGAPEQAMMSGWDKQSRHWHGEHNSGMHVGEAEAEAVAGAACMLGAPHTAPPVLAGTALMRAAR
jgi:hypothetical protein